MKPGADHKGPEPPSEELRRIRVAIKESRDQFERGDFSDGPTAMKRIKERLEAKSDS